MKQIDANLLKEMFISASNNLYNHYPEIDALNVFPVPDGDTGMNMNLTLTSGAKEIQNRFDDNVYDLAKAFSKGLLMGARGNSGVITSQIFRGFANGLEGKQKITVADLANAFAQAKVVAYKAVIKPVEGTILTVLRESSQFLKENYEKYDSIEGALAALLAEAKDSLKRTPELLPVLKEVGVVDSGGAGYVTIIEGMYYALKGNFIEKKALSENQVQSEVTGNIGEEEFGYCTEFIMELGPDSVKKPFNEKRFVATLGTKGNSMVVVRDEEIVKVHIHTLTPGWVFTYAQQFGEFKKLKVENMTEQHHELMLNEELKKQEEKPKGPQKEYAMIAVSPGEGISEMFKELGVDEIISGGQTMNPSIESFIKAIEKLNAKNIFILPNNSNIVMAAAQAAEVSDESINVQVIPTSTVPQGIVAAMNFYTDDTPDANFVNMKQSLKNVKSASITYAIKDTEIDGVCILKDQYIALVDKHIISCMPDKFDSLKSALDIMINEESEMITIFTGEDITEEETSKLENELTSLYPSADINIIKGDQPVYSFIIGVE